MTRIAFLHFGVLGDCLLATVSLAALRERYPDAHITWYIAEPFRDVAAGCPLIDTYIAWPFAPEHNRHHQERHRWADMKQHAAASGYDLIVTPQIFPDHKWEEHRDLSIVDQQLHWAGMPSPRHRRIHFRHQPRHDAVLQTRTVGHIDDVWAMGKTILPVNAVSVTQPAVWAREQYADLAERMIAHNVLCVFGDTTIGDWPRFQGSIAEWHALIEGSFCHIGLDSGGTWLACATDTPQVVLYGSNPTVPRSLSGVLANSVKPARLINELTSPTVADVVHRVVEIAEATE